MSSFTVETFLHDLAYKLGMMDRFKAEPDAAMAPYPLTEQERDDIKGWNVKAIHDSGVSPMLLMLCYTGVHGMQNRTTYLRLMGLQGEDFAAHVH